MTTITTEPVPPIEPFEVAAVNVMRELRESFLGVQESLPKPIRRAADLERALGLRRMLAWQVHRIATTDDPLAVGPHVPGSAAMRQVIRQAQKAGISSETLQRVSDAMSRFEQLVEQHAGDRAMFATMIASLADSSAAEKGRPITGQAMDLATRRQAVRALSQLWGVHVKTTLRCTLYHPGKDSSKVDSTSVRGLHGVRRLRVDAPFSIGSYRMMDATQRASEPKAIGDSAPPEPGPGLLPDYCSRPCPRIVNRVEADGSVRSYLEGTALGNTGAQTVYLSDVARDLEWNAPDESPNYIWDCVSVSKPTEVAVIDTLIHRGMFDALETRAMVLGSLQRLCEQDPRAFSADEELHMGVEARSLGVGTAVLPTPHVPRYREMIESVCKRVGWNAQEFEVFRCVVEYPLLGSVVSVRFELPERGNW